MRKIITNKNAQVNQIFIYIMSVIMIVFVGFLVSKFIFTFSNDAQDRSSYKIYDTLKKDYNDIFHKYGSEKNLKYKVPSNVNFICFISDSNSIDNIDLIDENSKKDMKLIYESNDNVIILDKGLKSSNNIGNFNIEGGSFCIKPNNGYFSLILENRRNKVYIIEG